MTPVERAYLAGFFDGEGNVGTSLVNKNRNSDRRRRFEIRAALLVRKPRTQLKGEPT